MKQVALWLVVIAVAIVVYNVFDTQAAHRLISNAGAPDSAKDGQHEHKNNNISLNGLLATYLGRQNARKDSIGSKMAEDASFWEQVRRHIIYGFNLRACSDR